MYARSLPNPYSGMCYRCSLACFADVVRQIPEKDLDSRPPAEPTLQGVERQPLVAESDDSEADSVVAAVPTRPVNLKRKTIVRRLSTIAQSVEHGGLDLESATVGGSARTGSFR